MIDIKKIDVDKLLTTLTYILEYALLYLLIPCHIENWIIIMDLQFMGLMSLPLGVPFLSSTLFMMYPT